MPQFWLKMCGKFKAHTWYNKSKKNGIMQFQETL